MPFMHAIGAARSIGPLQCLIAARQNDEMNP